MIDPVTRSTGNVFADLGFDDEEAALLSVKSTLLSGLAEHVRTFGNQHEAAEALGIAQPRVSEIVNGRLSKFSTDLLVKLCHRAGLRVTAEVDLAA